MAKSVGSLFVRLGLDTRDFKSGLQNVKSMSRQISSMVNIFRYGMVGAGGFYMLSGLIDRMAASSVDLNTNLKYLKTTWADLINVVLRPGATILNDWVLTWEGLIIKGRELLGIQKQMSFTPYLGRLKTPVTTGLSLNLPAWKAQIEEQKQKDYWANYAAEQGILARGTARGITPQAFSPKWRGLGGKEAPFPMAEINTEIEDSIEQAPTWREAWDNAMVAVQADAMDVQRTFDNLHYDIAYGWENTMARLMTGSLKFRDFSKQMFLDVANSFVEMTAHMIAGKLYEATFGKLGQEQILSIVNKAQKRRGG